MNLIGYLREECIQVESDFKDKTQILHELAKLAKKSPILNDIPEELIFKGLSERESIGSTGFNDGIAIPHCRIKGISEFVIGMLCIPSGIDFDSIDKSKTELFFLIIAPEEKRDQHIRILSSISRTMAIPGVKAELLEQNSPTALRECFLRHVINDMKMDKKDEKCLLQIIIQREDKFTEILEIVSTLSVFATVVEGSDPSSYLHDLPLFAMFWNGSTKGFNKLIFGTINKKLVNEMVRRIDLAVEGLDRQSGIMINVQDILVSSGSLNI